MMAKISSKGLGLNTKIKKRGELHIARRFWHVGGVLLMLLIFNATQRSTSLLLLCIATMIIVPLDILRLRYDGFNQKALRLFKPFIRQNEVSNLSGMSYMLFGVFVSVLFFPKLVVNLALLFLMLGDPIATAVGVVYGKDKIWGSKSLQGTGANFLVCTLVAYLFFWSLGIVVERLFLISVLAGLISAFSELIPIGRFDDNLSYPLLSSLGIWSLLHFFGGLG